jgi:hypothetical protein
MCQAFISSSSFLTWSTGKDSGGLRCQASPGFSSGDLNPDS